MFKVKQFLPQQVCIKCKGCCRFAEKAGPWQPSLLEEEIGIISQSCPAQAAAVQYGTIQLSPFEDYYVCPFLNTGDNRCRIYDVRPFECRLYPFLINKTREGIYLSADLNCPFIKDKAGARELSDYVNYLVSFLSLPAVASAIKRNPRIPADYSQGDSRLENLATLVL